MNRRERFLKIERELLIKLFVIVRRNFGRIFAPERSLLIRAFRSHVNRKTHKVGMFFDDLSQFPRLREFVRLFFQRNMNFGAAICLFCGFDTIFFAAVGNPRPRFAIKVIAARNNAYLVGDHENGIKPDAELSNHIARVKLSGTDFFNERARPRLRDGAEIRLHFRARHADARIFNDEFFGFIARRLWRFDMHGKFRVRVKHRAVGEHFKVHPRQRVRRVGNQFAQKDVAFFV